ncbi:hypothetical protein Tco_0978001 [Tanacetum coccineum]|uniref:Uncharacterized protein n=1 Tax=Tanacetum coccineum TaxID=301880 RepID=A0ABQ5ELP4_9ASTR
MFLYMDQLQKQLDNEEFQDIGSMSAYKVLEIQFQMFIKSRFYLDDEYVDMIATITTDTLESLFPEFRDSLIFKTHGIWVNERTIQQKTEEIDYISNAWNASSVIIENNGTESKEQDTSSKLGNDAHVDDADIRPIYAEEPMAEVPSNKTTKQKQTRFRAIGLHLETKKTDQKDIGKTFASSTTKVESEPPNGSNAESLTMLKAYKARLVPSMFKRCFDRRRRSRLGLHCWQMTSDHIHSELGIQVHPAMNVKLLTLRFQKLLSSSKSRTATSDKIWGNFFLKPIPPSYINAEDNR